MNHIASEEIEGLAPLYALGALTQHEARAFEEHLAEGCPTCREELEGFEAVVGLLGASTPAAEPSEHVRENLLGSLSKAEKHDAASSMLEEDDAPQSLTIRAGEGEWQEAFQGVYLKNLFVDESRGTVTTLFRMEPGAQLPRHLHHGVEECFVLEGDVQAGEQMLGAGDYHCAMPETIHERLSTVNGAVFLIVGPRHYEMLEQLS
jgi:anti-sigma factor ChrR (cupin superfamily)